MLNAHLMLRLSHLQRIRHIEFSGHPPDVHSSRVSRLQYRREAQLDVPCFAPDPSRRSCFGRVGVFPRSDLGLQPQIRQQRLHAGGALRHGHAQSAWPLCPRPMLHHSSADHHSSTRRFPFRAFGQSESARTSSVNSSSSHARIHDTFVTPFRDLPAGWSVGHAFLGSISLWPRTGHRIHPCTSVVCDQLSGVVALPTPTLPSCRPSILCGPTSLREPCHLGKHLRAPRVAHQACPCSCSSVSLPNSTTS